MAHLDPGGTIKRVVREYEAELDRWKSTYYLNDATTDPPSELIVVEETDNSDTTGTDSVTAIQAIWTGLHS